MEHSLSSLVFKGTIIEAITRAKQEKKLFVVYLAGDNPDSKQLETSTWTDPNVSETLTKYCVLLHVLEGSSEALQFSAIYPQNSSPSITAIGYNGVQLWQTEGVVTAEVLASSLEKAWLSLHVQETTAALLTAALASEQNSTSHTSENSVQEIPSANESSGSSSRRDHIPSLNVGQLNSETIEERNSHEEYKDADSKPNNEASLKAPHTSVETGGLNESTSRNVTQNTSLEPHQTDPSNSETLAGENSELHYKQNDEAFLAPHANVDTGGPNESASRFGAQNTSLDPHKTEKRASPVLRENLGQINEPSRNVTQEANKLVKPRTSETNKVQKTHTSASPAVKSNDVFLNIRMPDGSSLQVKFTVMDTLRMVKDYISENSMSKIGSFDLAIPYPRKVFNEQELIETLSSVGLLNRQALVVIPRKQTYSQYGGRSSSSSTYSSNGGSNGDAGYWASLRTILSYANPFSYFSGAMSPNVAEGSQNGTWQYSSNPSLGNNLRSTGTPSTGPSSDQNRAPATASGGRQKTSGFGGNIHTLKRDEDEERPNDRNMFWNGNSTEYGGDSDGK